MKVTIDKDLSYAIKLAAARADLRSPTQWVNQAVRQALEGERAAERKPKGGDFSSRAQ